MVRVVAVSVTRGGGSSECDQDGDDLHPHRVVGAVGGVQAGHEQRRVVVDVDDVGVGTRAQEHNDFRGVARQDRVVQESASSVRLIVDVEGVQKKPIGVEVLDLLIQRITPPHRTHRPVRNVVQPRLAQKKAEVVRFRPREHVVIHGG